MTVLLLLITSGVAYAQQTTSSPAPRPGDPLGAGVGAYDFEFSGLYTWGEVITSLCAGGWCRVQLPREFYNLSVPLSVFENSFDDAFKALSMQALADGFILRKIGKEKPYKLVVTPDQDKTLSYISCLDTLVKNVPSRDLQKYKYSDSLKCYSRAMRLDSIRLASLSVDSSSVRFRVSFYVVSSSFVQSLGIQWTDIFSHGDLFNVPELITNWTFRAVADDDSLAEYRSLEIDLDSSASIHWGSQAKEEKSTVVYNNGVSQTDYEWRDFGLTLDITRTRKHGVKVDYKLAQRDENNSVLRGRFGGGGSDSVLTYGVYDSFVYSSVGVPFLSSVPLLGNLFKYDVKDKIRSFFVISVYRIDQEKKDIDKLDSLRKEDVRNFDLEGSHQNDLLRL